MTIKKARVALGEKPRKTPSPKAKRRGNLGITRKAPSKPAKKATLKPVKKPTLDDRFKAAKANEVLYSIKANKPKTGNARKTYSSMPIPSGSAPPKRKTRWV